MSSDVQIAGRLNALRSALGAGRATNIGYPGATDLDYSEIIPFFGTLLNNVGDPWTDPAGSAHTKPFEREVLDWFADLFGADPDDRWGYLTTGGTEGNLYSLYLARTRFTNPLVYYSAAAHYSVPKCVHLLGMESVTVRAGQDGEMDYADFSDLINQYRHRPAIVVANCGTTMTEAADDVPRIRRILASAGVRSHVHVDAALTGVPLALLSEDQTPLRLSSTIDSIAVSGHKFLGAPIPCGVVLTRRSLQQRISQAIDYTATLDTTISGSRCGQVALLLWYVIRRYGLDGLRARAYAARELAGYAVRLLTDIGWRAWRHPHALTVVFDTPAPAVKAKWVLASSEGRSHLVCMPGVRREYIDAFVRDVAASSAAAPIRPVLFAGAPLPPVPRQAADDRIHSAGVA